MMCKFIRNYIYSLITLSKTRAKATFGIVVCFKTFFFLVGNLNNML